MSKIPYPLKKIKAVVFDIDGVLSPATVPIRDNGVPRRMGNLKDGFSMAQAIKAGLKIIIISGASSEGVRQRFQNLGVTEFVEDKLRKLPILKEILERLKLNPEEVAYVGDDVPDVAPMKYVGLPITPADGSTDTKLVAKYVTEAIGGHGVAREVIEEILRAQDLWQLTLDEFSS